MNAFTLPEVSARRRRTDRAARGLMLAATLLALLPLALIVYYLLHKGLGAVERGGFFTADPTGGGIFARSAIGGIKSAIIGTVEIVAIASAIAIPLGIGVALYLTEYGGNSALASAVRYFIDVLTGVPSIIFGLFIYIVLVSSGGFAGYKGSIALALLMLPVITRSAEVVLLLVPNSLRESALALGAPRWRVTFSIVLRTALAGMVTGVLLAVARAAGETAPLLFTAFGAQQTVTDPGQPMNSLPYQIFGDIQSPSTAVNDRAWGAALTLVVMILLLNVVARLFSRRSRLA